VCVCVGLFCYIVLNSLRHVYQFCYSSVDVALHGCQIRNGPVHPGCNATSQVDMVPMWALWFACPSSRSRGRRFASMMSKAQSAFITIALIEKLLYLRDLVLLRDMCMCV